MAPQPNTNNLTLWEIESGLLDLLIAREEAQLPEEIAAVDQALIEYTAREISKVDGYRGLIRHCDMLANAARQEAQDQAAKARSWEARRDWLKEQAKVAMEGINERRREEGQEPITRLQGRTGYLLLKGNGGLQPLEITNGLEVPAECCKYVGWINEATWQRILGSLQADGLTLSPDKFKFERVVDNDLVRKAIQEQGGVPGARLGERGKHVEIK